MIEFAIVLVVLLVMIMFSRMVELYAHELFSSSGEILNANGSISPGQREFLEKIAQQPHDLMLTATLLKTGMLGVGTGLAIYASAQLRFIGDWLWPWVAFVLPALFWLGYTFAVDIQEPRGESQDRQRQALSWLWLIQLLYHICSPFRTLAGSSRARFAEDRRDEEKREEIVERAIETLAGDMGTDEPIIEDDERQMIQQIFRMDTTEVREVMVPRFNIVAIPPTTTLAELREIVTKEGHSRLPVYQDDLDTIIGIVHVKDIFCDNSVTDETFILQKYYRDPLNVPETQKIDKLLDTFRRTRIHLAIVVDEYGGTAGLVSLEDILEEIVGEIEDEHDFEMPDIIALPDNAILVSGQVALEDIYEHFELKLDSDEFETVAGLIYDIVGGVPTEGKELCRQPFKFTVTGLDGQRIDEVRIERLPEVNDH